MSIGEDVYKLRGLQMVLRTGAGNFCILGFDKLWIGYNDTERNHVGNFTNFSRKDYNFLW